MLRIFGHASRPAAAGPNGFCAANSTAIAAFACMLPLAANALLPPADVECCQGKDYRSERCARFVLSEARCAETMASWNETYRRFQAAMTKPLATATSTATTPPNSPPDGAIATEAGSQDERRSANPAQATFRGRFFEVRYPAGFSARPLDAARAQDASAATFTSPGEAMTFHIFSPQWGGPAPGLAPAGDDEQETERRTAMGNSSGVPGTYTWYTITARDRRYTRTYQDFLADDKTVHWVIGMTYKSGDDLARYKTQYADFKASLRQFAD